MSLQKYPDRLKADSYSAKAVEALDRAAKIRDPDLWASWKLIARSHREMAERLEPNVNPIEASTINRQKVVFR
jgi:hypothetical protein